MFKYKTLKIFFINILFSISLITLFLLIKEQIMNYLQFLKDTAPKLSELQTALQNNLTENVPALQTSINELTKTATKFMLFQYLLIPLLLFIFWVLFQGLVFYYLSNSKDIKKYLARFSMVTIPFYLFFLILIKFVLLYNYLMFVVLFLIIIYYLLILYLNLDKPIKIALKEVLNSLLKPELILIYLLLVFLVILYLITKLLIIISIMGEVYESRFLISLALLIIFILLISLTQVWFSKKI